MELHKKPGENDRQFIFRIGQAKDNGLIDINWDAITDIFNQECNEIKLPTEKMSKSTYFQTYRIVASYYTDVFKDFNQSEKNSEDIDLLTQKTQELYKQQVKTQDVSREYRKILREQARDELILDEIKKSIAELEKTKPLAEPKVALRPTGSDKGYVLAFGDEHYGVEYEIKGINGEILNAYNPTIYEERMWKLFYNVIDTIEREGIETLNIFSLGDFQDGILRVSQLMKLKYGVIDSAIKYSEFLAQWLNELSKYVYIKYHQTDGNHSELRMIGQPKGTFTDDNMGKIVLEFLKLRLSNNLNIEFIENPTGLIYTTICNYPILCIHGEVKSMEDALKDFSMIYKVPINYLFGGHLHHSKNEEVGMDYEVINIPSIIGIDKYSLSLRKTANPGARLFVFKENEGIICEHKYKLK